MLCLEAVANSRDCVWFVMSFIIQARVAIREDYIDEAVRSAIEGLLHPDECSVFAAFRLISVFVEYFEEKSGSVLENVAVNLMNVEPTLEFLVNAMNFCAAVAEIRSSESLLFIQQCGLKYIRAVYDWGMYSNLDKRLARLFELVDLNDIYPIIISYLDRAAMGCPEPLVLISRVVSKLDGEIIIRALELANSFNDKLPANSLLETLWKSILRVKFDDLGLREAIQTQFIVLFEYVKQQWQTLPEYRMVFCKLIEYCVRFDETQRDEKLAILSEILQQPLAPNALNDWLLMYATLLFKGVVRN
jgi:hypothetical protein